MRAASRLVGAALACASAACSKPAPVALAMGAPLPKLRATKMAPVVDAASFHRDPDIGTFTFAKERGWSTERAGEPFPTDEAAVDAAIAWVVAHFGPLPRDTTLVANSILPSSNGGEEAEDREQHPGHTIVLEQRYRGTSTEVRAVIHIAGQTVAAAHVDLAAFTASPGSEAPVITAEAAISAVDSWLRGKGATEEKILTLRRRFAPRLLYVSSAASLDNVVGGDGEIFEPNWEMVPDEPLLVNAHTGKVWVND